MKFAKIPPPNGTCESLNIYLSDENLKNFAQEYQLQSEHVTKANALVKIDVNSVLENFIASLRTLLTSNLNT